MNKGKDMMGEEVYFKSSAHGYVFILLYTDGTARTRLLRMTTYLYHSKSKATKWRDKIASMIHPDHCSVPRAKDAYEQFLKLYDIMIED